MLSKIALVTGATRGVGRGIALALGRAGWTVWVTGRSSRQGGPTSHLPGIVEETAEAVTASGGRGVAVMCDHRDDQQVRVLAERMQSESGALHLLVNNAWGGYERLNAGPGRSGTRRSGSSRSDSGMRCSTAGFVATM